jgi:hypothetical protein
MNLQAGRRILIRIGEEREREQVVLPSASIIEEKPLTVISNPIPVYAVSQLTSSKVRQERSQYRVSMRQAIEKQTQRIKWFSLTEQDNQ